MSRGLSALVTLFLPGRCGYAIPGIVPARERCRLPCGAPSLIVTAAAAGRGQAGLRCLPTGRRRGPGQFRGQAVTGNRPAGWDLAVTGGQPPLRPLRPPVLYRTPLPRTKLEASVPDGQVTGLLDVDGRRVSVSGWRGTVGRNWGSEHADSWVWLHAAGFAAAPEVWLELVLARIRVGPARSPWTAMAVLSLSGERIVLGGLGLRPRVDARPGWLTAYAPLPVARLSAVSEHR